MTATEHADNTPEELDDIKLGRETLAAKEKRYKKSWGVVLATEEGRAVLWNIMARTGMMETPGVYGEFDKTWAKIGRGDYGRELYVEIGQKWPALFQLMVKENAR